MRLHESCQQYVDRRLSEGWNIVWREGHHLLLSSPDGSVLRPVDLRNDVETLWPDGVGDVCNISHQVNCSACDNHYDCVNAVDDTKYVRNYGTTARSDLYGMQNHAAGSGVISSVTIYFRFGTSDPYECAYAEPVQKSGVTVTQGTIQSHCPPETYTQTWVTKSQAYATNPATGSAYTWDEIDALQVGVRLDNEASNRYTHCSQVYIEVDYTPALGPTGGISPGAAAIVVGRP